MATDEPVTLLDALTDEEEAQPTRAPGDELAGTALALRTGALMAPAGGMAWTRDQVDLVKTTVAKGSSDDELRLFMHVCQRTGLDPFAKQIYFIKRWDSEARAEVFQPQVAIDGLRLIAERSHEYRGRRGPFWCGEDGVWSEVWLGKDQPFAAKVEVLREGREPTVGIARFDDFAQKKRDGGLTRMWSGMGVHMIGKVAEALALRAAFPQELGDVYSFDELPSPSNQGEGATDEPVVEEAEVMEHASEAEIDTLKGTLKTLEGVKGWAEGEVVDAARKSFRRPGIKTLADLTSGEVAQIQKAATAAVGS